MPEKEKEKKSYTIYFEADLASKIDALAASQMRTSTNMLIYMVTQAMAKIEQEEKC
jgi:predicted transcriptional regulator